MNIVVTVISIFILLIIISGLGNGTIQDNLLIMAIFILIFIAIISVIYYFILSKAKKIISNIPNQIILTNTNIFIDEESYAIIDIDKIIMTSPRGKTLDGLKKIIIKYGEINKTYYLALETNVEEYFKEYHLLFKALQDRLKDKFSLDVA